MKNCNPKFLTAILSLSLLCHSELVSESQSHQLAEQTKGHSEQTTRHSELVSESQSGQLVEENEAIFYEEIQTVSGQPKQVENSTQSTLSTQPAPTQSTSAQSTLIQPELPEIEQITTTPQIKENKPAVPHLPPPRIITEAELGEIIPDPVRNTLDIRGQDHHLTVKERDILLRNINRTWLAGVLSDSVPYRPYVRQKLKENNMPMVLQYLPVVESNYKITAVSRSGAVGMWQFMANSMYPFLSKNNWYDQRKDPWLATDAAIKKLKDNYRQFGDWALAIGAYNCGAGAMQRAINKAGKKDYWYLASKGYLSSQTTHYVPKLMAIADIVENAEYYGAIEIGAADKLIEYTVPEEFDWVKVTGMLSYNQIAEITKISVETVKFLNPCLLKGCTPPQQTYNLRFPKGTGEESQKLLEQAGIPKDVLIVKVQKGDTLWGLSKQYGVTVKELCEANGIKENSVLSINQSLIIPIFK